MGDPVIIDDGGSTRIKQMKLLAASGKMDDLLEVDETASSPNSKDFALGPFSQITILCISVNGVAGPPDSAAGDTVPIALNLDEGFEIVSENNQRVIGKIIDRASMPGAPPGSTARDCLITVKGVSGSKPIIEARHGGKQRRYIVSNAGPIIKVVVSKKNVVDKTFTVPQPTAPSINPPPTAYTMVVLT